MDNNFSEEYKKLMLDAEESVKKSEYPEILPEDVFLEISKLKSGGVYDLFTSYGVNEKIVSDVFGKRPFSEYHGAGK